MANPSPTLTLYHNPHCSKSRAALALLEEADVALRVVEYLRDPLTEADVAGLLAKLDTPPASLVRTGEAEYDGFDVNDAGVVAQKLAASPILMERPVVAAESRALVARPPERVRELLDLHAVT